MSKRIAVPKIDIYADFGRRSEVADSLELEGRARWSIYEVVDQLDDVAFIGSNVTLRYKDHWGPSPVSEKLPDNPTWRQLAHAAGRLIRDSKDQHHVFVELFLIIDDNTLEMWTGS